MRLSDEDARAAIAVAAYEARWYTGPSPSWLVDRMGWSEWPNQDRAAFA